MNRKSTRRTGAKGGAARKSGPRKGGATRKFGAGPRKAGTTLSTPSARTSRAAKAPAKVKPAVTRTAARIARPVQQEVVPPHLSGRKLRELRARAHELEPVVQVGNAGLSEAVVRAVNGALHDHELIKVRLHEPEDKQGMAQELAGAARAALCGLIGHTLILYRPRPKGKPVSGVARTSIRRNQPKPRRKSASRKSVRTKSANAN